MVWRYCGFVSGLPQQEGTYYWVMVALVVKNGWILRSAPYPGGLHGNPLQYFCLENPIDRGAWGATVHRVTKSQA